ncbi:MAG: GIY-YIG nuclease family protein [Hyphomicrobiales bacterium]
MDDEKFPAVYMMSNMKNGTLYIGVTSKLWNRVCDHKNGTFDGFTKAYGLHRLVWYAHYPTMVRAIRREKQLKKWLRRWKIDLINAFNPGWADLHDTIDPVATLVDEAKG